MVVVAVPSSRRVTVSRQWNAKNQNRQALCGEKGYLLDDDRSSIPMRRSYADVRSLSLDQVPHFRHSRPSRIPTEFQKSIQVHFIVVRLKLPSVVLPMFRVYSMPFRAFGTCAS
jgi:hypothetical protein